MLAALKKKGDDKGASRAARTAKKGKDRSRNKERDAARRTKGHF